MKDFFYGAILVGFGMALTQIAANNTLFEPIGLGLFLGIGLIVMNKVTK